MRDQLKIFTIVVISVLLATCSNYNQKLLVNNTSNKQNILLRNNSNKGNVYRMAIRVRGNIKGNAKIHLILDGNIYKTEQLGGNVNFKWDGDWYSDTAEILYEPNNVESGELVIEYKFYTIN